MTSLKHRPWVPQPSEQFVQQIAERTAATNASDIAQRLEELANNNRVIHEQECFNLNPATNVMNPRAEALLAAGLGSRPSLGYPVDKYEMGLEAIEEIEVIAAEICAEIFQADYAEIRVASGAMANLYGFMATCRPGDAIIVPPATIGGHVTHHADGCAGLYGLEIHHAPVDASGYSVSLEGLETLSQKVKPKLITIGGSLNLFEHPVAEIRKIADTVGAKVLFDAAHQCGIIAGRAWKNPIHEGAHLMTMSTYKSLGGPPGGLIVSNDAPITQRLDAIAFPGMTANFDAGKSAALALSMLDWRDHGKAYAHTMIDLAQSLAAALQQRGISVFANDRGFTNSHQFAIEAAPFGGGQSASKALRKAGFLACGIGLPVAPVAGDLNGLRIGTPELVRWGVTSKDTQMLADLIARGLTTNDPQSLSAEVRDMRAQFRQLHFINGSLLD